MPPQWQRPEERERHIETEMQSLVNFAHAVGESITPVLKESAFMEKVPLSLSLSLSLSLLFSLSLTLRARVRRV